METSNINFNQIEFGRLEPNSLYAIKFPSFQSAEKACGIIDLFNDEGKDYEIKFIPFVAGMEIVNGL